MQTVDFKDFYSRQVAVTALKHCETLHERLFMLSELNQVVLPQPYLYASRLRRSGETEALK